MSFASRSSVMYAVFIAVMLMGITSSAHARVRPAAIPVPAAASDNAANAGPSADEVMTQAKAKAVAEHKNILLVFSASWCGPCHLFQGFLLDKKMHPIMDREFVIAELDAGERPNDARHADSPGAMALMAALGGARSGYPYIVMLDATGQTIVDSLRPDHGKKANIGYPALAVEIDWFMTMLQKGSPSPLSPKETKDVKSWLQGHSPL